MGSYTENLGLFKYDPITDAKNTFNVKLALNDNFDKIDEQLSSGGYRPPLLQSFWHDRILNRVDLLRADTFSWQSGTMYQAVFDELKAEYDNENCIEETEGGITFKRTPNGYKIADSSQETAILNKYNTYGIAWYYILDKENTQFKLPRTKFGFEGLRDSVGNDIAESLPQHTHIVSIGKRAKYQNEGGASAESEYGVESRTNYTSTGADNSTYQDNAPVQERATQMYLYFYVGNYTQSAIEQTAGINAELFNNKADKTEVDGEWVVKDYTPIIENVNLNSSTNLELDLTEFLPKDNNIYECIISGGATTGTSSGNNAYISLCPFPYTNAWFLVCRAQTRTSSNITTHGSCVIPVGTERKIYLNRTTTMHGTAGFLNLNAYRKVR